MGRFKLFSRKRFGLSGRRRSNTDSMRSDTSTTTQSAPEQDGTSSISITPPVSSPLGINTRQLRAHVEDPARLPSESDILLNTLVELVRAEQVERNSLPPETYRDYISMPTVSPVLKRGEPNIILCAVGSYNPPHRGHLEALGYGKSEFLNVTAAFICPSNNKLLAKKMRRCDTELALPTSFRYELWENEVRNSGMDWLYVLKTGMKWGRSRFLQELIRIGKEHGVEIVLYSFFGPDSYNPTRFDGYECDSTGTIWCEWSRDCDMEKMDYEGRLPRREIKTLPDDPTQPIVYMATLDSAPEKNHEFFVRRPAAMTPQYNISSTLVRSIISDIGRDPTSASKMAYLHDIVISPTLLIDYLKETGFIPSDGDKIDEKGNIEKQCSKKKVNINFLLAAVQRALKLRSNIIN